MHNVSYEQVSGDFISGRLTFRKGKHGESFLCG